MSLSVYGIPGPEGLTSRGLGGKAVRFLSQGPGEPRPGDKVGLETLVPKAYCSWRIQEWTGFWPPTGSLTLCAHFLHMYRGVQTVSVQLVNYHKVNPSM